MGGLAAWFMVVTAPSVAAWLTLGRFFESNSVWRIWISVLISGILMASIRLWMDASDGYCCRESWPPTNFELAQEFLMNTVLGSLSALLGLLLFIALKFVFGQLMASLRK